MEIIGGGQGGRPTQAGREGRSGRGRQAGKPAGSRVGRQADRGGAGKPQRRRAGFGRKVGVCLASGLALAVECGCGSGDDRVERLVRGEGDGGSDRKNRRVCSVGETEISVGKSCRGNVFTPENPHDLASRGKLLFTIPEGCGVP